ncbi:MAG TPA: universal stress protein [Gemmatimonadota bacterium]
MYRHLLVPLDGSPLAESALPAAVKMSALFEGRVTLLHVMEAHPPKAVHGSRHLVEAGEAEAYLAEVEEWLRERDVTVDSHVHAPGMEPARGVADHARELGADLVVLCAHGGRGMRGLLHGRLGQQVVAEANTPALVVPTSLAGRDAEWRCARILAAMTSDPGERGALDPALALARAARARLVLVRVVATPETVSDDRRWPARLLPSGARAMLEGEARTAVAYLERLGAELAAQGIEVSGVVERGDPVTGLTVAAARLDADVLVLATRGAAGLSAVWTGSVTARLIERVDRSLLLTLQSSHRPPRD